MEAAHFLRVALPALVMAAAALFQINTAQAAACAPPPVELCATAPAEEAAHCQTLAGYLADFQQQVCSLDIPDPAYTPGYAAELGRANANLGPTLLTPWNMNNLVVELDRLAELGVGVIRLDIVYPLLTPGYHAFLAGSDSSYTTTAEDYLAFYRSVVGLIRARGLQVHIEHSMLLAEVSPLNPAPYYATLKELGADAARQRYRQERGSEALLILTELAPDALTLLSEPDTDNNAFGSVDGALLYTPEQWQDYVSYALSLFPAHATRIGAGAGTWDSEEYMRRLAALPELDYIDMHVYPARGLYRDYLANLLTWPDLVRSIAPTKEITVGEAWLYKADAGELASLSLGYVELLGRDVYSYWEPLDTAFIELIDQAAHAKQIEVLTPFWSRYFYAYLDYATTSHLSPLERMATADTTAFANLQAGVLTGTGRAYRDLALATNRLVIGSVSPNHGPQTGPFAAQTVILSGANFTPGSVPLVFFGDAPAASVQVIDTATLAAVTPAGSGSVTVTVTSPDGRSASKPNAYTYDPPPTLSSLSPVQGPEAGGTFVTLEGSGFSKGDAPAQLFFGDLPASDVTVLEGQILARTPPGIGLGQVTVTVRNPDGQSAALADGYRFIPKPQVNTVSPAAGPSGGGSLVTIRGQHFMPETPGTTVLFGTWQAPQVTVLDDSTLQAIAPEGMGTVKITVINPDLQTGELADAFTYVYPPAVLSLVPYEGVEAGGNEVWIGGSRFEPGAQVFFGDKQAAIQSSTANTIRVIAPAGSGSVPVQVVNPDGQVGQSEQAYTYSSNPAPAILYFTPAQIPPSGGAKVYLYGQNFKARATVHFGAASAPNVWVLNSTWIQVTAPPGQGSVPIRVTNPDGKQATSLLPMTYSSTNQAARTVSGDAFGIGGELTLPEGPGAPTQPGTAPSDRLPAQAFLPALRR